jgi:hypothetical protein
METSAGFAVIGAAGARFPIDQFSDPIEESANELSMHLG